MPQPYLWIVDVDLNISYCRKKSMANPNVSKPCLLVVHLKGSWRLSFKWVLLILHLCPWWAFYFSYIIAVIFFLSVQRVYHQSTLHPVAIVIVIAVHTVMNLSVVWTIFNISHHAMLVVWIHFIYQMIQRYICFFLYIWYLTFDISYIWLTCNGNRSV